MQARPIPSCGVCLSVCLSVTFVDFVEMNKQIFKIFSPSGSHTSLIQIITMAAVIIIIIVIIISSIITVREMIWDSTCCQVHKLRNFLEFCMKTTV